VIVPEAQVVVQSEAGGLVAHLHWGKEFSLFSRRDSTMNNRGVFGGAIAIALLILSAWAFGWLETTDPIVAELQQLRDDGIARHDQMTDKEKKASKEIFGERIKQLPKEQQLQFFESSMPLYMKMAEARIDRFLALTPEEQNAELDKKIDQMQASQAQKPSNTNQNADWAKKSPDEIDAWRKKKLDWTTPELRAKFEIAKQKYSDRLEQRGIDPK
jgi:hypothetical protein